jgi:hypothetical protein
MSSPSGPKRQSLSQRLSDISVHAEGMVEDCVLNDSLTQSSPSRLPVPPEWQPDEDADSCNLCGEKFSFLRRRHHCRRCGLLFCSTCCVQKLQLPEMGYAEAVLVCNACVKHKHNEAMGVLSKQFLEARQEDKMNF